MMMNENDVIQDAILVIGPAWVGDMVMAQSLFKQLKEQDSESSIDVVAPKWTLPLLERMPEVRSGIEMPVGHGSFGWGVRKKLGQSLRGQYQQAYVLPNTWKSALVPWFAKISKRTGFRGEMRYGLLNDLRSLDEAVLPKMIQRYASLALPPNERVDQWLQPKLIAKDASQVLQRSSLRVEGKILGLCPGAEYGPAKQWPLAHYAALSQQWLEQHQEGQVWIFGSDKDQFAGQTIVEKLSEPFRSRAHTLAGKTALGEAIDLMALCSAVVSNDSGLMHVAAALDLPLVALFGSSTPEYTPPNGAPEKTKILWRGLECSPCFKRECPLGTLECLTKITPQEVLSTLGEVVH
jgi:heptosyltransferase-2